MGLEKSPSGERMNVLKTTQSGVHLIKLRGSPFGYKHITENNNNILLRILVVPSAS